MAGENERDVDAVEAGGEDQVVDTGAAVVETGGGEAEQGAPEPDDGLTVEERGQFEAMRTGAEVPADGATTEAAATVAAAATGKPGEHDDDDDDDADEPGGAADAQRKKPRRISFKRYEALERERNDLAAKVTKSTADQARIDERLKIINEALAARAPEKKPEDEDPEPDPDEDFLAHGKWMRRRIARLEGALEKQGGERAADNEQAQVIEAYENDFRALAAQEPNFQPAYLYLITNRIAELGVYFYGKDLTAEGATITQEELAKIRRTIQAEENEIVRGSLKAGVSPAARMFMLAKARGYRPAAPAPAAGNGAAAPGNGAAKPANGAAAATNGGKAPGNLADAAAAVEAGGAPAGGAPAGTVRQEIERIKNGSEAALSLSLGGGAPRTALTTERLVNMSDDEFAQFADQMSDADWKRISGGA